MLARVADDGHRADDEQPPQVSIALLGDTASLSLPPVLFCFGTNPIQAARLRPDEKAFQSPMSASLIGHSGSSTFRLSASAVSMSLAGSCFSSESAPGPFHHGIRGRGGTIF